LSVKASDPVPFWSNDETASIVIMESAQGKAGFPVRPAEALFPAEIDDAMNHPHGNASPAG
jgi:hypothetical protein